jgi:hypothetical protein
MSFYEGYNYRINIVSADSSVMVDSETGLIRANIVGYNEQIIVDVATNIFHGTLAGNIVDQDLMPILDIEARSLNLSKVTADQFLGDLHNKRNQTVFNAERNTITNVDLVQSNWIKTDLVSANKIETDFVKGNIQNHRDETVFDVFHNSITNIDDLYSKRIKSDHINGNIYDNNENLLLDTSSGIFYGKLSSVDNSSFTHNGLKGNIFNNRGEVVFDFSNNHLNLDAVTTVGNGFLIRTLNEYDQEIVYKDSKIGFSSSKSFDFSLDGAFPEEDNNLVPGADFDQVTVLNTSITKDKNSAGFIGFYGFENEDDRENNLFKLFGSVGFVANYKKSGMESIPSDFVVISGREKYDFKKYKNMYDFVDKNMLVFDHKGVLKAPVIKTGVYTDMSTVPTPEKGMIVFNDATGKFQGYTGTGWVDLH